MGSSLGHLRTSLLPDWKEIIFSYSRKTNRETHLKLLQTLSEKYKLFVELLSLFCSLINRHPPSFTSNVLLFRWSAQSTRETLERDLRFAESNGIGFAAKMVRGAYMYKERLLSTKSGHSDPIHATYDATSAAYDAAVALLLNKMAARPRTYRMIVASHNERSTLSAVKRWDTTLSSIPRKLAYSPFLLVTYLSAIWLVS